MSMSDYVRGLRTQIGSSLLHMPSVATALFDTEGRLLMAQQAGSSFWMTVGGAIEPDESPSDAAPRSRATTRCNSGVVPQAAAHLQRCARCRPASDLARAGFGHVTSPRRPRETPSHPPEDLGLRSLPRRLNGQSRA